MLVLDEIVLPGKSKSGRLIKPKRFFEDTQEEEKRRPRKRSSKVLGEVSEENSAGSRRKCSRTSTQCAQCELELASHSDLFRHLLVSHVPPEVVKTLPVYAEGETGWCQNCEEPLPLSLAEQHMAEKHPELLSQSVVSQADLPTTPALSFSSLRHLLPRHCPFLRGCYRSSRSNQIPQPVRSHL